MKISNDQNVRERQRQLLARAYELILSDDWGKEQQTQKKVVAEGTATTIQGNNSNGLERNCHDKE